MAEPREYTAEEIREHFLSHLRMMVDYWASVDIPRDTVKERLDGLAFSFLSMIDGSSGGMPGFRIFPSCHEDDPEYHRENGENWWPVNDGRDLRGEITDGVHLHEMWYRKEETNG
jgi:hypothetical protein